jgi:peptide/nickel transport system substrate-binding protein
MRRRLLPARLRPGAIGLARRSLGGVGLIVACALLLAGCRSGDGEDASYLRVAIANSPTTLDPRVGVDEASQRMQSLVYSSLFVLNDHLDVVGDLAASWETPDPLTHLVHLKPGVRFHDGRLLTSADVVYTYRSLIDPAFTSGRKGAYRMLASIDAVDASTVRFTLKEPFGSFLVNLVMGIVPDGATNLARQPVGSGPYRFVRAIADDRVVLTRFDGYFGTPAANPGLVLRIVPDDTMRGLELRKGSVDLVVNDLGTDIVRDLERRGEVRVTPSPGCDFAYVGLNLRDPLLADVRVRRALAHAVDRQAIVQHLRRGLASEAAGILPAISWAAVRDLPTFAYDPARAKALLDEAGHRDPDGDGPLPRFTLTLKSSNAELARLQSTVIQQNLRQVGIGVEIRSYEFATFLSDVIRGNFQLCTLQWVGVSDPDMLRRVFHSAQVPPVGWNRGFFKDPEVDALIERATRSVDRDERLRLFGDAQRRIAEAAPYISLWHKTNVVVSQPGIRVGTLSPTADFSVLATASRQ